MLGWEVWFAVVPGLILFLYGIENFSREILNVVGGSFRSTLSKITKNPLQGTILGAIVTAIMQSSTATTVITISLVNAGAISFAQSLGVLFGSNIGSTITAQLVAFKLTGFGPLFILFGFVLSIAGGKYRFAGKPLFYFGLVFFSISLMAAAIEPIKGDPGIVGLFAGFSNVFLGIGVGIIATIILQSSAVTTGIVVLLAASGMISLEQGIPILLGANIGTTATTLLAASGMDLFAKRASVAHLLFNVGGVLIFLPFLPDFSAFISSLGGDAGVQVANAHLIFNIVCATIFLIMISQFRSVVERLVPGTEEEILFHTKYLSNGIPDANPEAFGLIENELRNSQDVTAALFHESATLLRTGKTRLIMRVDKLEALNDFLDEKIESALLGLSTRKLNEDEAEKTVLLVRISNSIEHLGDRGRALGKVASSMSERGVSFSPAAMSEIEQIYAKFSENIEIIGKRLPRISAKGVESIRKNDIELRALINSGYKSHLRRLYSQKAYSGTFYAEVVSLVEASNANVREIRKLAEMYSRL